MNTLHDELAALRDTAAAGFSATNLAHSTGPVRRRVRRDRAVTASVGAFAVIALGAGTAYGVSLGTPDAGLAPAGTPSTSPTPEQTDFVGTYAQVTMVAGGTTDLVAEQLAEVFGVTVSDARRALDDMVTRDTAGLVTDSEGWIAPGTYSISTHGSLEEAADLLTAGRWPQFAELGIDETNIETLTIASLIEAEVRTDGVTADGTSYRAMVSAVITNRLAADMLLELDSPLFYALDTGGPFTSDDQRSIDSPYNTYLNRVLPPTPIGNPSVEAIEAALNPADTDALYFVLLNPDTGEMAFASNFEEHLANVEKLQAWYAENGADQP
ncbi:endolytic transglycosylase MltG [Demequina sp. NBRC 110052]|uniref:endolytic transglycosylase MltG n=1 Tax=Demequina sp. NBRC 110052 TaxID=1570341 RepID=UPI000A060A81|nr:endolytic transglycosylase MltG [Demequina sp. NBRC 110052]